MPNLADVQNDPNALVASVDRMMDMRGSRGEVRINHGVRNSAELDALVAKAEPVGSEPIERYQALLGSDPKGAGELR